MMGFMKDLNFVKKEKSYSNLFAITQVKKYNKEFLLGGNISNNLFEQKNSTDLNKCNVVKSLLMESLDNFRITNLSNEIHISDMLEPLKNKISNKLKKELYSLLKEENILSKKNIETKQDEVKAYKIQKNELDRWEPKVRKNREKSHMVFQNLEPVDKKTLLTFQDKIRASTSYLFSDITALNQDYLIKKEQLTEKNKKTNIFFYNANYKKKQKKKKGKKKFK